MTDPTYREYQGLTPLSLVVGKVMHVGKSILGSPLVVLVVLVGIHCTKNNGLPAVDGLNGASILKKVWCRSTNQVLAWHSFQT